MEQSVAAQLHNNVRASGAPPHQDTYSNDHHNSQNLDARPHTSYSDTGFRPYSSHSDGQTVIPNFSPPPEADPTPRYAAPSSHPTPRPSSQSASSDQNQRPTSGQPAANKPSSVVIKVGMVGDAQIGKTSLMVKYVEGSWDEDYIQTLGVNFMEKTISIRNTEITFSIWDLGGQREFVNMLPLVCNDAVAILFMFDLTRKSTLNSIKEWYRQGRGFNKTAIPFLVGTKYDHFVNFPREEQEEISNQASPFR